MSQSTEKPSPPPVSSRLAPQPPAVRRGCTQQLLSLFNWLLTLVASAALGIIALALIAYFVFGFTLATPDQIRQSSAAVRLLQTEVARFGTAEAGQAAVLSTSTARIETLEAQTASLAQQEADLASQSATTVALGQELATAMAQAATIQAEGRESQVLVQVVATIQAENSARLATLEQRSDRVGRFIDRLGDLAGDVNNDTLSVPTATPVPTPTVTAPPTP